MKPIHLIQQLSPKIVLVILVLVIGNGAAVNAKPHEYGTLNEAFTLSEAEMHELLIEYYPAKVDIQSLFVENVKIYDQNDKLIYDGTFEVYGDNAELESLIEQSDFLIYTQDTSYYLFNR